MSMTILQSAAALIMSLTQPNGDSLPDFSRVGYRWGDKEIPDYKVTRVLEAPVDGADATAMIQEAIDAHYGEGAILLKKGRYNVSGTIYLNKSGLTLRGEGNKTVIYGTGKEQRALVRFGNKTNRVLSDEKVSPIVAPYTPVGQLYVEIADSSLFHIGDKVVIRYQMNDKWIHDIKMDQIPMSESGNTKQWTSEEFKFCWERKVIDIQGNKGRLQ